MHRSLRLAQQDDGMTTPRRATANKNNDIEIQMGSTKQVQNNSNKKKTKKGTVAATTEEEKFSTSESPFSRDNNKNNGTAGTDEENGAETPVPLYLQIEHARQEQIRQEQEKKQKRRQMCCAFKGCLLLMSCIGIVGIFSLTVKCGEQEEFDEFAYSEDDKLSEKGCKSMFVIAGILIVGPQVFFLLAYIGVSIGIIPVPESNDENDDTQE